MNYTAYSRCDRSFDILKFKHSLIEKIDEIPNEENTITQNLYSVFAIFTNINNYFFSNFVYL